MKGPSIHIIPNFRKQKKRVEKVENLATRRQRQDAVAKDKIVSLKQNHD